VYPELIPELKEIVAISAGRFHSFALTKDGSLFSFGNNFYGQLGHGDMVHREYPEKIHFNHSVVEIAAADWWSMLKTKEGKVYPFGRNIVFTENLTKLKGWSIWDWWLFRF
jgi:alpha-tubulin suppressor-like RCC1 family protein